MGKREVEKFEFELELAAPISNSRSAMVMLRGVCSVTTAFPRSIGGASTLKTHSSVVRRPIIEYAGKNWTSRHI
jgi:hypothetical protein